MNKKELVAQVSKQTLDTILAKENENRSIIYLYAFGDKWYAYEHSAYHFSQLFHMGEIEQVNSSIRVVITQQFEFLCSTVMESVEIVSIADDEVKIDCGIAFAGYSQWKEQLLH